MKITHCGRFNAVKKKKKNVINLKRETTAEFSFLVCQPLILPAGNTTVADRFYQLQLAS